MKTSPRMSFVTTGLMSLVFSISHSYSQDTPRYGATSDTGTEVGTRPAQAAAASRKSDALTVKELEAERQRHLERVRQIDRALLESARQDQRRRDEAARTRSDGRINTDEIIIVPDPAGGGTRGATGGR